MLSALALLVASCDALLIGHSPLPRGCARADVCRMDMPVSKKSTLAE